MIDIIGYTPGESDAGVFDTEVYRARNILQVQIGSLEYAQSLGIDLKYFLSESFRFQNESFKSYLIQVLSSYGINVSSLIEEIDALSSRYIFNLVPAEPEDTLIAR